MSALRDNATTSEKYLLLGGAQMIGRLELAVRVSDAIDRQVGGGSSASLSHGSVSIHGKKAI
jgi:hypothetical protein